MGHVIAAVQVRVVGQAFPAHGGARFFDVGAHYQQHVIAHIMGEGSEVAGVFQCGDGIVDGAGADHYQ